MRIDWGFWARIPRASGRTLAMIEAAKKIEAYLVVRDGREVERITRDYGVKAVSVNSDLTIRGTSRPVLFDPDAVSLICANYESEIAWLKQELAEQARKSKK